MTNPRDFIPAKYKKSQTDEPESSADISADTKIKIPEIKKEETKTDSPWSDLAQKPEVPEYRNADLEEKPKRETLDTPPQIKEEVPNPPKNSIPKKKSGNKLAGVLVVFFLVIGLASSYLLSKQSQDNRQQASGYECDPGTPYCDDSGFCTEGYTAVGNECVESGSAPTATATPGVSSCTTDPNDTDNYDPNCVCSYESNVGLTCRIDSVAKDNACGDGYYSVNGHCIPVGCQDEDGDGQYVCGYNNGTDPCTEDSMGGNWCVDPITGGAVSCESVGMIRCQCSPGSDAGYWVIGIANSCNDLCGEAEIVCEDCDEPGDDPDPTPTPTPVPETLACGETGCNTNADCDDGLTCQEVSLNGSTQGICALGSNQLFCAADPTTANCCEAQAMPVCASIDILDTNNNLMEGNDDENLSIGDTVRFRCSAVGNQGVVFNYEFRIWDTSSDYWTNLTDTSGTVAKNVSDSYIITTSGNFIAQGRICWEDECQTWEVVDSAPTTTQENN